MAIVKRRPKEEKNRYTFLLPEELKDRLTAYSEFTNVSESEIVAAAVDHAIKSDKEFAPVSALATTQKPPAPTVVNEPKVKATAN